MLVPRVRGTGTFERWGLSKGDYAVDNMLTQTDPLGPGQPGE